MCHIPRNIGFSNEGRSSSTAISYAMMVLIGASPQRGSSTKWGHGHNPTMSGLTTPSQYWDCQLQVPSGILALPLWHTSPSQYDRVI